MRSSFGIAASASTISAASGCSVQVSVLPMWNLSVPRVRSISGPRDLERVADPRALTDGRRFGPGGAASTSTLATSMVMARVLGFGCLNRSTRSQHTSRCDSRVMQDRGCRSHDLAVPGLGGVMAVQLVGCRDQSGVGDVGQPLFTKSRDQLVDARGVLMLARFEYLGAVEVDPLPGPIMPCRLAKTHDGAGPLHVASWATRLASVLLVVRVPISACRPDDGNDELISLSARRGRNT